MPLKRSASVFLLALASCAPCLASAVGCPEPLVLFDLRSDPVASPPDIAPAMRERLSRDLFGSEGQAFTINSFAPGSFTRRGADEDLYVVQRGGPDATDPAGQTATIAIYADGRLIRSQQVTVGNFVERVVHGIAADGRDAVLLRADSYQMGVSTVRLALADMEGSRWREREVFADARVDACESGRPGSEVEAQVVRYCVTDGAWPAFLVEHYRGACDGGNPPAVTAFRRVADGAPATEGSP